MARKFHSFIGLSEARSAVDLDHEDISTQNLSHENFPHYGMLILQMVEFRKLRFSTLLYNFDDI